MADPLADTLTMFTVTVLLARQQSLPWWFASVLVARDIVIITAALATIAISGAHYDPTRGRKAVMARRSDA